MHMQGVAALKFAETCTIACWSFSSAILIRIGGAFSWNLITLTVILLQSVRATKFDGLGNIDLELLRTQPSISCRTRIVAIEGWVVEDRRRSGSIVQQPDHVGVLDDVDRATHQHDVRREEIAVLFDGPASHAV